MTFPRRLSQLWKRLRLWRQELDQEVPRPRYMLPHSRWAVVGFLAAAALLGVANIVTHGTVLRVDRPISEAVRGERWQDLCMAITNAGGQIESLPFMVVIAVIVWWRCRSLAIAYPLAGFLGVGIDVVIKLMVNRPRPPVPDVGVALGAFPSGHAIHAVVLFGLLVPVVYVLFRSEVLAWAVAGIGVVGILAVGMSRVYLGAHWPSDILASYLIGATLLLAIDYVLASPVAARFCGGCPLHRWGPSAEEGAR